MDDQTRLAGGRPHAALEPVAELAGSANGKPRADEIRALRAALRESEQRLARLPALEHEARLAAADRMELDALRERVDVLEAELREAEGLRAGLEHASRTIDDMEHSLSWRVTAPLRALKRATGTRRHGHD